ncbi:hypothetical protein RI054_18g82470 [Pseudoscourfieldia marina]
MMARRLSLTVFACAFATLTSCLNKVLSAKAYDDDATLWQPWHHRSTHRVYPAADVAARPNPKVEQAFRRTATAVGDDTAVEIEEEVEMERTTQGVDLRSIQRPANLISTTPYLKAGWYASKYAPPIQFAPIAPAPPPPTPAPPPHQFGNNTYISATALRLNPFLLFPFAPPPFEPYMNEPCFGGIAKGEGGLLCPGFPRIPNENYLYRDRFLPFDPLFGIRRPREFGPNSYYYPGLLRASPPLAPQEASWQRPTYSNYSPRLGITPPRSQPFYVNIGFTPRKGLGSIGNQGRGYGVVPSYGLVTRR